jgi:hypothetical protein
VQLKGKSSNKKKVAVIFQQADIKKTGSVSYTEIAELYLAARGGKEDMEPVLLLTCLQIKALR